MSRNCSKVEYPLHNQSRFRKPCGSKLMKVEYSMDGKRNFLYPFKVYSYRKIKDSLQNLLNRPNFLQLLEKTHLADQREKMNDIYRSFLDSDGSLFFKNKRNIGVLANLDWFNPFKRTEYLSLIHI